MPCKNADTTFFRSVTNQAFDRQTNTILMLHRVCIPCSTEKILPLMECWRWSLLCQSASSANF